MGAYTDKPLQAVGPRTDREGRTVSQSSSADEAMWEGFKPDAARAIRAQQGFEDAVAGTLDCPFDVSTHGRVVAAVVELGAAVPAAMRVAQMQPRGGV